MIEDEKKLWEFISQKTEITPGCDSFCEICMTEDGGVYIGTIAESSSVNLALGTVISDISDLRAARDIFTCAIERKK